MTMERLHLSPVFAIRDIVSMDLPAVPAAVALAVAAAAAAVCC